MKRSNIVLIFNGLGNQMSQYAFYLAMHDRMPNTKYICWDNDHNGYELERLFGIRKHTSPINLLLSRTLICQRDYWWIKIIKKFLATIGYEAINENLNYCYTATHLLSSNRITFWYGGWHNYRYFNYIDSKLRDVFRFPEQKLNVYSSELLSLIQKTHSVGIHIRRGDYLQGENRKLYGDICTISYYKQSIEYIKKLVSKPRFFIFSNDAEWVQNNLDISSAVYVNDNTGSDSWMDMFLMSKCKNLIIANSTFSWWGAYLSNADYILCPTKFINDKNSGDIYPDTWIRIDSTTDSLI